MFIIFSGGEWRVSSRYDNEAQYGWQTLKEFAEGAKQLRYGDGQSSKDAPGYARFSWRDKQIIERAIAFE
jgi:hypothetical protein